MRTLLMGVTPWVVSLAACLSASAQDQDQNRQRDRDQQGQAQGQSRNDKDRHAGKQETIRGVIAGVTVAGEVAVNYQSNRAEAVEMSYLTIVGSPEHGQRASQGTATASTGTERDRDRDRDRGDRSSRAGRHRHNVYLVWLTPNTKVCEAQQAGGGQANKQDSEKGSAQKPRELSWEELEVGDHVEVTFTRREGTDSAGSGQANAPTGTASSRKHGRHRTYFGDAVSVTILPESQSQHYGYSPDKDRGERSGSDKDRSERSGSDKDRSERSDSDKDRSQNR